MKTAIELIQDERRRQIEVEGWTHEHDDNQVAGVRHLDLFSGIGGFALAARWMNWETVQFVELDKFCQKVLQKNFPNVPIHDDIKTFDGKELRGTVDILTGGFPCQPASVAGKRKGTSDDRWLWPQMLRVIRETQPEFVVGENVLGLLTLERGMVLKQICADLAATGYEVAPLIVLPACGVDAPHLRYRVWIVAHADRGRSAHGKSGKTRSTQGTDQGEENKRQRLWSVPERTSTTWPATDSTGIGHKRPGERTERNEQFSDLAFIPNWRAFPTQSPVRLGNDGLSAGLVRSAIKGAGNAVVPILVYEIFKAIEQVR